MNIKTIIVVSGEMAAGKGVAAQRIEEKYYASNIRSSDVFRRALEAIAIEESRENVSEMSRVLRIGFGEDVAIKTILKEVEKSDRTLFVIEGIRRKEEIEALQQSPYATHFIFLTVEMKTRYERMILRNENDGDAQKTFEEFKKNHLLDAEKTQEETKSYADYIVENDGTLEEMYGQVDGIIEGLGFDAPNLV